MTPLDALKQMLPSGQMANSYYVGEDQLVPGGHPYSGSAKTGGAPFLPNTRIISPLTSAGIEGPGIQFNQGIMDTFRGLENDPLAAKARRFDPLNWDNIEKPNHKRIFMGPAW